MVEEDSDLESALNRIFTNIESTQETDISRKGKAITSYFKVRHSGNNDYIFSKCYEFGLYRGKVPNNHIIPNGDLTSDFVSLEELWMYEANVLEAFNQIHKRSGALVAPQIRAVIPSEKRILMDVESDSSIGKRIVRWKKDYQKNRDKIEYWINRGVLLNGRLQGLATKYNDVFDGFHVFERKGKDTVEVFGDYLFTLFKFIYD